jgi:hypothetical protein
MEQQVWKLGVRRTGAAFALVGIALMIFATVGPPNAGATANNTFAGTCVGTYNAGTCTLDEPEGSNPATHGTVTYARALDLLSFVISPDHAIQEVQICMQESGAFAAGANVCAGIHGNHVAYTSAGNVYTVDLAGEGFADSDPLFWTLHVVSNGATLQVLSPSLVPPPTTTTTTDPGTTTTTLATTTTTVPATTTTVPATTTTVPATTTTVPATTSTTEPSTTTTFPSVTSTTAPPLETTTTTLPTNVLGKTLSRTGGIQWWVLVTGAFLLLFGTCLLLSTRIMQGGKLGG